MSKLTIQRDGKVFGVYTIKPGRSVSIGRKKGNNIIIDNPAISSSHAKLDYLEEGFLLSDLRSKNGTMVNGEPVDTSRWLKDGDVISIGRYMLVFSMDKNEVLNIVADAEDLMNVTVVLNPDELI